MTLAQRPTTGTADVPPARPWDGIFDTPPETPRTVVRDIDGEVPTGLVGSLYRNGPGRLTLADHLFDGDGMVSKIRFEPDGTVEFQNRFVRTEKFAAETGADRPRVAGYGTRRAGGVVANALRRPTSTSNAANTSVMFTAGRLLALWEAGHPWQVDPDTLETLGEMDFDGALAARMPFSAHPHWDPKTREVFNFGMVYGPKTVIATYRIDPTGRLHHLRRVPVPSPYMNHDFILTDRYLVFCLGPVRARLLSLLSGRQAFGDSLRWHGDEPTLVVLVPRDGSEPTVVEAEPWFQFHFGAAFDDGDDVVVDLARYPDYDAIGRPVKDYRTSDFSTARAELWRYRVSPARRAVEGSPLTPTAMEFPQVDGRRATGDYRHLYGTGSNHGDLSSLVRVDTGSGQARAYDFGPGRWTSEPLFVPRPDGTADDDGWVVATVYDPARRASDAVVLDARRLEDGPLCTVHLPVNTGVSFHGTWRRG